MEKSSRAAKAGAILLKWLLTRATRQALVPSPSSTQFDAADVADTAYAYSAALELERRLYENAVSSLDQVFAKEGLIAAFLSSGALIAYAACLQAFAQLAPQVGQRTTWCVTGAFLVSLLTLVRSAFLVAGLFAGRNVQDVDDARKFLDEDPVPITRNDVDLALVVSYREARIAHKELVEVRLNKLFVAMGWVGAATLIAFLAMLLAFLSVSLHKKPISPSATDARRGTYNKPMAKTSNDSGTRTTPTPFPNPKGGTTMVKGGGGNGKGK